MQKIIIASGPVIVRNSMVLLDKSGDDNFWKFCGGRLKDGKSLLETATERAKEELGIDLTLIDSEPFLMYAPKPGEENIEVILVHFLADFEGDVIISGASVREWAWLPLDNLPTDLAPNIKPVLKHFGFLVY